MVCQNICREPTVPESDGNGKGYAKQLKKLIKRNHPAACLQMGFLYRIGDGVIQSDTKSLEMFLRAAELGVGSAFAMIGNYYVEGDGVAQDLSKALEYQKIATKKGNIPARRQLAFFHERNGDIQISIKQQVIRQQWIS